MLNWKNWETSLEFGAIKNSDWAWWNFFEVQTLLISSELWKGKNSFVVLRYSIIILFQHRQSIEKSSKIFSVADKKLRKEDDRIENKIFTSHLFQKFFSIFSVTYEY